MRIRSRRKFVWDPFRHDTKHIDGKIRRFCLSPTATNLCLLSCSPGAALLVSLTPDPSGPPPPPFFFSRDFLFSRLDLSQPAPEISKNLPRGLRKGASFYRRPWPSSFLFVDILFLFPLSSGGRGLHFILRFSCRPPRRATTFDPFVS